MRRTAVATAMCSVLLLAACATTNSASGDDPYPDNLNALTVVVPFAPGGTSDTIARLVAPRLEDELGVPVQILNRPERDGQAGMEELAEAGSDGATIGFTNLPSAITSYLGTGEVGFDRESFTPIGGVTSLNTVIAVHDDSRFANLTDLVDAAREDPGSVTLAAGALDDRVQVSEIQRVTGAEFNTIPFAGGSSGEVTALLGQKVDAIIGAPVAMIPGVKSGDFRVVAVFGPDPVPGLPDTASAQSQGVDLVLASRIGLSAPAGTDPEALVVLSDALEKISVEPKFIDEVEALGYSGGFVDPARYGQEWMEAESLVERVIEQEGQ
ncbi:Bug family tripartite tricarboxylate transporter substrate binding protein [Rhodococcoides kyotonense]|uniref:Tripartite-type tricarboxylate transporter, receptor component TctC n=1 Tax=Rhodococcoides kyotonense TaxID=398843 RepID=A0A239N1P0_9NOCA|nr:tripartite tricarboxylate transporter substrate binding protein [Rhodococcus kyotonensis]SNT48680.1 Tripartite-type tricarboxylate transporter, receptor component TctC [Rhodococcus kyotonensis]